MSNGTPRKSKRQRTAATKDLLDDSARSEAALFSADAPTVLLQDAQDRTATRSKPASRLLPSKALPPDPDSFLEHVSTQLVEALETLTGAIFRFMTDEPTQLALDNLMLVEADVLFLKSQGMQIHLQNIYQDAVQTHCSQVVHEQMQGLVAENEMRKREEIHAEWSWDAYSSAVGQLAGLLERYEAGSAAFEFGESFDNEIQGFFEGTLRNALSPSWLELTQVYFDESFARFPPYDGSFVRIPRSPNDEDYDENDPYFRTPADVYGMDQEQLVAEQLVKIGMRDELCAALLSAARKRVRGQIEAVRKEYHVSTLGGVLQFAETYVRDGWLAAILDLAKEQWKGGGRGLLGYDWNHVIWMSTRQDFCTMRTSELFSMVQEAEEEVPEASLRDLKECLNTSVQKDELVKTLRTTFEARVCHIGVPTEFILTLFVAAEKCLRLIDPSTTLLMRSVAPIRKYILQRRDLPRQLLTLLLDEEGALAGAIRAPEPEDDEDEGSPNWLPEPVDAIRSRKERNADTIARLTEGCFFVPEFHTLLLEKLLRKLDYDTHEETLHLELLKIRFGDVTCLSQCEVMLADVATSRRIHNHTRDRHLTASQLMDEEPDEDVFSVVVTSHLYWPKITTREFRNPVPAIRDARNVYSSRFPEQKPNRRLEWRTGAGTVEVELATRDGQTVTHVVSELEAAVIWLFGDDAADADDERVEEDANEPQWMGLAELMVHLKAETSGPGFEADVSAALAFWVGKGCLIEDSGKWRVVEDPDSEGEVLRPAHGASAGAASMQKREEERQRQEAEADMFAKFGPMIVSIVTNQGAQSPARIENLLSMFFQYSGGPDPVKRLLDKLVHDGTLSEASGGIYFLAQS
ncbi:Anaphase-promoting complex subunit 2 [Geranomyces variabilis]|nr:Anaphase-promoting complex subunit 2 [Geranomyces variabilis]